MALSNKALNNISNFLTSYVVRDICKNEETYNKMIKFVFDLSKDELTKEIIESFNSYEETVINQNINADRVYLFQRLKDFVDQNNIETRYFVELNVLSDPDAKIGVKISLKYNMGYARAAKIRTLIESMI